MFNTFASYLFGGKNTNNDKDNNIDDSSSSLEQVAILDSSDVVELTTVCAREEDDDDQDWLLVERQTKEEEDDKLIPVQPVENLFNLLVPFKSTLNLPLTRNHWSVRAKEDASYVLSTHLPALYPSSMDESWFVTPPQCFTSVPIHLPENPLENLLIEHTSMSVYCSIRRNSNQNIISKPFPMVDDLVVLELTQDELEDDLNETVSHRERSRRNGHRISNFQQQQNTTIVLVRNAQKTQELRKNRQSMGRSALERTNKSSKVNGRSGRTKRSDMQSAQVSSRANNNRKANKC